MSYLEHYAASLTKHDRPTLYMCTSTVGVTHCHDEQSAMNLEFWTLQLIGNPWAATN